MDEGDGLENRCTCKRTVGSNPTPSANFKAKCGDIHHISYDQASLYPWKFTRVFLIEK